MKNLDGNSIFTSDVIVLIYYACALIALCTGFLGIVALVGAIVTRMIAKKENAVLVAKHCSWIANTIWFTIFATMVVTIAIIVILGTVDMAAIDQIDYSKIDEALNDPALTGVLTIIFGGIIALLPVLIWYVYRVVRGVLAVFGARAPKK